MSKIPVSAHIVCAVVAACITFFMYDAISSRMIRVRGVVSHQINDIRGVAGSDCPFVIVEIACTPYVLGWECEHPGLRPGDAVDVKLRVGGITGAVHGIYVERVKCGNCGL